MDRLVLLDSPKSPVAARYINAGYWPQWIAHHQRYPSTFDLSKLSHIFYAFASINLEGSLRCTDNHIDVELPVDGTTGCIRAWTQLKLKHPHLQIILSIGGEGASGSRFARVSAHAQRREHFSASAKYLLQLYNLDGIDINWDPWSMEEGQHLLELVRTVRKGFKSSKYMVIASLTASQHLLRFVPLAALSKDLDFVNLIAYNFVGPRSAKTGHHAQLSTGRDGPRNDADQSCETALNYLKR